MSNLKIGKNKTDLDKIKISISHGGKLFICNENKKIYNTQHEAAIDLKIPQSHISAVLNKRRKSVKGFSFIFLE